MPLKKWKLPPQPRLEEAIPVKLDSSDKPNPGHLGSPKIPRITQGTVDHVAAKAEKPRGFERGTEIATRPNSRTLIDVAPNPLHVDTT
jgi:hypothetical protein